MIKKIRDVLIEGKIYLSRSISYLTIINAGMILFLTLSKLKEVGIIDFDIGNYFILVFIISIIGALIIGYIDVNIVKGFSQENRRNLENNPIWMSHIARTDEIYNELKKEISKLNKNIRK